MKANDLLMNASVEDIKNGFSDEKEYYMCLLCGKKVEKGIVYQADGVFYEAGRYMIYHIKKDHGSVFESLLQLDKRYTGLTEHQSKLLELFYQGKSDEEVRNEMNIGSSVTIRNHRFMLKEKERQAKIFLTMMELLKDKDKKSTGLIEPHKTAKMVDDRYRITKDENDRILKKYFTQGLNGPITTFDMKQKSKLVVLKQIAKRFEMNRIYAEKEVNEVLKKVYAEDYVTLRRYLIEYGFMDRKSDGSQYWLKENQREGAQVRSENEMDRKKELKEQYKEMKTEAGVYQIKNTINQKIYIESTPNLKTMNGRLLSLQRGMHRNKKLQDELNQFGEKAFVFEVLEVLKEKDDGYFDKVHELKKLKEKWLEKLQPFGDKGYN